VGPRLLALAAAAAACTPARQPWSEAVPPQPEVFLDVLPRDAEVRVDAAYLGRGPVTLRLGEAPVRAMVAAPGFEPRLVDVDPRVHAGARLGVVLRPVGFGAGRPLEIDDAQGLAAAGAWLLRAGRVAEAVGYAERAVEVAPNAPEPRRVLGLALARQGKKGRAAQELSSYLQLAPSAPDRDQIEIMVTRLRGDIAIPVPRE
jgi:tetratricopeptide (TPR) repeat protein